MTRVARLALGALLWAAVALAAAQGAAPPAPPPASSTPTRLPLEALARLPAMSGLALSPDGQRIAALVNEADRTVLITRPAAGGKAQPVLETDNQAFHFRWAHWVGNDRLLVSVIFASSRYDVRSLETRLLSVKPDGSGVVNLVVNKRQAGSHATGRVQTQQYQDQIIDWWHGDGRRVLLQLAYPDPAYPSVYELDVETGERKLVQAGEREVLRWMTDAQHRVRIGLRAKEKSWEVRARDPEGTTWRTLWTYTDPADAIVPIGFGVDPNELYIRAPHEGRTAVFSVRLDLPDLPRTLRASHPRFDINGGLIRAPVSGAVLGVQSVSADDANARSHSELWDAGWNELMRSIDSGLPGRINRLRDISDDGQRYLVYSSGNGQPGEYYVGDRRSGQLALAAETYPGLDTKRLARKQAVMIKARDGLELQAFLTRASAAQGPLVMLPHGGPNSRDAQDFDAWTSFLASRGYHVLQVNFRGSSGYGRAFNVAGLKRWGLEMQDDVTDAVQWAIAQGIADAKRVCIVGASYGGYAALMGVAKTPELYRCAVSFAGVSDLQEYIRQQGDYQGGTSAAERAIGDPWRDSERLRATSPAALADRIRVPVLLVHGSVDRSVPIEQSEYMVRALKRAGKPHRFIELAGGDHGLSRNAHRVEFFQALEAFLAEHLAASN